MVISDTVLFNGGDGGCEPRRGAGRSYEAKHGQKQEQGPAVATQEVGKALEGAGVWCRIAVDVAQVNLAAFDLPSQVD